LGRMAGNLVEVHEAIACLRGEGPLDLWELTRELAGEVVGGLSSGFGVQGSEVGGRRSVAESRRSNVEGPKSILGTEYSVLSTESGAAPGITKTKKQKKPPLPEHIT